MPQLRPLASSRVSEMTVSARLAELGIDLPSVVPPVAGSAPDTIGSCPEV